MPVGWKHIMTDGSQWDSNQHLGRLRVVMFYMVATLNEILLPFYEKFLTFNKAKIQVDKFV